MVTREVLTERDKGRFIRFPWRIYRDNRHWVPPSHPERQAFLDPRRNPFFDHADVKLFLACGPDGEPRGRLAAIVNHNHIRCHGEKVGFFGLFECVDDPAVAASLFEAAAAYLRGQGMVTMRGPENLCVNDDIGLLIDGFDLPPAIMMPYNPPYYVPLVEQCGFQKAKDLYAYYGESPGGRIPERVTRGVEICRKRFKFDIRPADMKHFDMELERIHQVYTQAWENNWGAVPMTDREFNHLAKDLKQVIVPDLCLLAEVDGKVAGFSLALPDLNQALIHLNGRLLPFGLFKLLWYKRKIDTIRIITLGVIKEYRRMGIDYAFYYETYRRAVAKGMWKGEMSWILEDNGPMNRAMEHLGFRIHKRYRLYDRPLAG